MKRAGLAASENPPLRVSPQRCAHFSPDETVIASRVFVARRGDPLPPRRLLHSVRSDRFLGAKQPVLNLVKHGSLLPRWGLLHSQKTFIPNGGFLGEEECMPWKKL